MNNPLKFSDPTGMLREALPNPADQGYTYNPEAAAWLDEYYLRWFGNGGGGGGFSRGHYGTMWSGYYDVGYHSMDDLMGSLWNGTTNNTIGRFTNVNGSWYHTSSSLITEFKRLENSESLFKGSFESSIASLLGMIHFNQITNTERCFDNDLAYPVNRSYKISSSFTTGIRNLPGLGIKRPHYGVDILTPYGIPVQSPAEGIVTAAKMDPYGQGGNYVMINHPGYYYNDGPIETGFLHLSRITVGLGWHVNKGDIIGYTGNSGVSPNCSNYGAHLDFRIYIKGIAINPTNLFNYGQ